MNEKDVQELKSHYKFHKGTTYSIGHEFGKPAGVSLAAESFVEKKRQEAADILPGRRNQEQLGIKNQNKVRNYTIGHDTPSVRGGDNSDAVQKRSNSSYNMALRGQFTDQFKEANTINKGQRNFIDSNKFDYGYDPNGGHRALSYDRTSLNTPSKPQGTLRERMEYKQRGEQQNFKIQPQQRLQNSETKKIGDTLDRFVKNEIDQDFLKRSHLPFAHVR